MTLTRKLLAAALGLAAACSKNGAVTPPPPPAVVCNYATPCALIPGSDATSGMIAAEAQADVYTVDIPASRAGLRTILQLKVDDPAPVTPVKLTAILLPAAGSAALATLGPTKTSGPQALRGNILMPGPGQYRVLVRDVTSTSADSHNGYSISAALLDDPDAAFEPDNTFATGRPIAFSTSTAQQSGSIAFAGDVDVLTFAVPAPGSTARFALSQAAVAGSSLRLRATLLKILTPGDLAGALTVVELSAAAPGAGVSLEQTRSLAAGSYAIAIDHQPPSTNPASEFPGSDATAAGRYTVSLQALAEPDPQEQTTRNDTAATATLLSVGGAGLEGAIGSQTDHDWYRIEVPAASTAKLIEVKLDPLAANTDLALNLTVAEPVATPVAPCDYSCGSNLLCVAGPTPTTPLCGFDMHALHQFSRGETTPEAVRIPHLGAARAIYVVVSDQGDLRFSNLHYKVSARVIDEPDVNELLVRNDTIDAGTILDASVAADKTVVYTTTGAISHWDYIDLKGRLDTRHDVDWYSLALPPRELGPPDGGCPIPDGGADGGDAGTDAGCPDVPQPRKDYGIAVQWHGPADAAYKIGISGTVVVPDGGGAACRFNVSDNAGQLPGLRQDGGTFSYGDQPTDLCFCLAARNAEEDKLWFRVDAYNRTLAPSANHYSEQPYSVTLSLSPGKLQTACDGGCVPSTTNNPCAAQ